MKTILHGAASEVITPFTADGRVDFDLVRSECEYLIDSGITAFFVNGLASEALMFDVDTRVKIVEEMVKAAKGRVPILANIIANDADQAIEIMHRYEDVGADGIFVTPPLVYKYTNDGLYTYISNICKAAKLPVFFYNAPETGNKVGPELVAKLFADNPNLQGYKDSTQDIIHQTTVMSFIDPDRHFELMAGSDAQIYATWMMGGKGVVSLITCVFPKLIVEMCDALEKGDYKKALELQGKILRVRKALKVGPFMAAYKYVGKLLGHPLGEISKSLSDLSESDKQNIEKMLKAEGML